MAETRVATIKQRPTSRCFPSVSDMNVSGRGSRGVRAGGSGRGHMPQLPRPGAPGQCRPAAGDRPGWGTGLPVPRPGSSRSVEQAAPGSGRGLRTPPGPRGRRTRLSEGSGHRYSQGPHPEPSSEPLPVPLLPPPQAGSRDHRPLRAGRATRSPGQAASQRFQAQSLGRPSSQEPCNKTPSSSHLRSPWRCVHLQCPGGGGGAISV